MIDFKETFEPKHNVNWRAFPTLVIESDDWGACEYAPTREIWETMKASIPADSFPSIGNSKLESAEEINALCSLLERFPGSDGIPATLTAFICLANPDYQKIRESNFEHYFDIPIDQGFPPAWGGENVMKTWLEWIARGIVSPEFHTRLHHTHPTRWLSLLRENSPEGEEARRRFDQEIYWRGKHDPEYADMSPFMMNEWFVPALKTFQRLFGSLPNAAITSDATPLTEIIWAANGIQSFCLRNFSIPGGEPIVYHTKPWNNQDPSTPMGAWNPQTDMVYLNRNIFFEPAFDPDYSFEKTIEHIHAVWERNEPAVVSSHRLNYANWNSEIAERGFTELERLLKEVSRTKNVRFFSTREIADVYRHGVTTRQGQQRLFS